MNSENPKEKIQVFIGQNSVSRKMSELSNSYVALKRASDVMRGYHMHPYMPAPFPNVCQQSSAAAVNWNYQLPAGLNAFSPAPARLSMQDQSNVATRAGLAPLFMQNPFSVDNALLYMMLPRIIPTAPSSMYTAAQTQQSHSGALSRDESQSNKRSRLALPSSSDTDSDSENETSRRKADASDGVSREPLYRVKGPWTSKEDKRLKELVGEFGTRWSVIAERLPGRIGKQCRERWLNHLDDTIKRSPWTTNEDAILLEAHKTKGNRWSEIAKLLPGRPENSVKNRYTSLAHKQAKSLNTGVLGGLADDDVVSITPSVSTSDVFCDSLS